MAADMFLLVNDSNVKKRKNNVYYSSIWRASPLLYYLYLSHNG